MRVSVRCAGVALAVAAQACASAGAPTSEATAPSAGAAERTAAAPAASRSAPKPSANFITEDEIKAAPGTLSNAYELVSQLRPALLQVRITPGMNTVRTPDQATSLPIVFSDGRRLGSIDMLRSVPRIDIKEIRYVNAADARGKYGDGMPGGVLQVVTNKGGR